MPTATLARYPPLYDMSLLAIAVLDLKTFTVVYSNASFLRQQKGHALVSGMELFREPLLREAAHQCWQQQSMVWTALPGSLLRIELAPLGPENSGQHYLQCLLLPIQPPAAADLPPEDNRQVPVPAGMSPAYARIIDHLPHNTWRCTAQGEVFWTNRTSNRFTYGTDEMHDASNTRYISKVHPDDLTGAGIALSRAMQGDPPERPARYRLRDHQGIFRWHEFSVAPVQGDDGQVIYWVGSSVNIEHTVAEHAALQAQLQCAHEELEQQRQYTAIEQKMALVNHLSGGIAHDLNNLLQVVVGCTEMALLARPAPAVESKLRLIADCTNRAGRMSSQLASFSGRLPQNARVLDTPAALHECAQLLQRAVGAEIAFEARIAGDLHPVLADRSQLENALINLAINARDAVAGRGHVVFEACNTTATDADGKPQAYVRLSLTDDGIGMDTALQQNVFEPFFTTKLDGAGTGLGLSMVRRFIDASQGKIHLQSTPGKGTRISLLLPRSVQQAVPDESRSHALPSLQLKVLLIEDDEQVRQAIHLLLVRLECDVIPSFNIDHALALLKGGLRPQAIISDIRMPGRNTIRELAAWVRENGDIPLLFATGYSHDVAVAEGLVEGKYPVLFKPFPLDELAMALQRQWPGTSAPS